MGLLDGKVAIVTGAGRGIGREEALLFAREGARVVVNDLGCSRDGTGNTHETADAVVAEIRATGAEAIAHYGSVADANEAHSLVALAVATWGGVDVLVNNAGIVREKSFLRTDDVSFETVMNTVVNGTFYVSRAVAQRMVEQRRGGFIVNTTGAAGLVGNLGHSAWSAACAAVYGLTRTMAAELKKHHIAVNALCPMARTRMTDDLPMFETIRDDTLGPKFVAPAALFLSCKLAGELTGEVLAVAGNKLSTWRMTESFGALGEDPRTVWAPEDIRRRWFDLSRNIG
jgi:NAD(P)-dependent dehydrogenase (short-subunit alcohol dehydrogenase family)